MSAADPSSRQSGNANESVSADPTAEADRLYESGLEALSANRYIESIGFLNQATRAGHQDVEIWYWLGVAYWNREMADSAIHAYRQAIALDPEGHSEWSLFALENLSTVYTRADRLSESRDAFLAAKARDTRPEWILKIRNQLAELALAMGSFTPDESTVFNDRNEVIGGVGPGDMRTNRAFEIARHTNDPEKEERYYRLAIETDPTMYQSYFNLGLALVRQGRPDSALKWLARSDSVWKEDADYNPGKIDKSDAFGFMALCYLELGALEEAASHGRRGVETGDGNFWARLYSLRVQVATGDAALALPMLSGLLTANPEHAEVLHALSEAYAALDQHELADDALLQAIEVIPDDHPWMTRLRDRWMNSIR